MADAFAKTKERGKSDPAPEADKEALIEGGEKLYRSETFGFTKPVNTYRLERLLKHQYYVKMRPINTENNQTTNRREVSMKTITP